MFDKFGEIGSVEELNRVAEGFKNEGDIESLIAFAAENGLDTEDAKDYAAGDIDCLVESPVCAALGRLSIEEQEVEKKDVMTKAILGQLITFAKGMCTDEQFCSAVMKKGKRISDILKAMRSAAREHESGNVGICCGTDRQCMNIIRLYYEEGPDEMKLYIRTLY